VVPFSVLSVSPFLYSLVHFAQVINRIGSAFGLSPESVILCAEYEKDCLDIKLWCNVNNFPKLLEMAYDKSGLKYTCQKKSWTTGQKMGEFTVYQVRISSLCLWF
jgi:hypothetical protein